MDELDARFTLLQQEMASIQGGIRATDTIIFQIKGWCITATLAIAGFALTSDRAGLLWLAAGAVVGFWLVDAYWKSIYRIFSNRDAQIEEKLVSGTVAAVLSSNELIVPGLSAAFRGIGVRNELLAALHEAIRPVTFLLYLFLLVLVGVEALVI